MPIQQCGHEARLAQAADVAGALGFPLPQIGQEGNVFVVVGHRKVRPSHDGQHRALELQPLPTQHGYHARHKMVGELFKPGIGGDGTARQGRGIQLQRAPHLFGLLIGSPA